MSDYKQPLLAESLAVLLDKAKNCLMDMQSLGLEGFMLDPMDISLGPSSLKELYKCISSCNYCNSLKHSRLFKAESSGVSVLFLDEKPGFHSVERGELIEGEELLWNIIKAMRLKRDSVYIAHILNCADPLPLREDLPCYTYFKELLRLLQPEFICVLGEGATRLLLGSDQPFDKLRGNFFTFESLPLMPTHHPADLNLNPSLKRETWEDVQKIMRFLKL